MKVSGFEHEGQQGSNEMADKVNALFTAAPMGPIG